MNVSWSFFYLSISPIKSAEESQAGDVSHDVRINTVDRITCLVIMQVGPVREKGGTGHSFQKEWCKV